MKNFKDNNTHFIFKTSIIVLVLFLSACRKENGAVVVAAKDAGSASNASYQKIISVPSNDFDSLFTRFGGGWTGGDGAFSMHLPDGRDVWVFGDSFLDTVYPDRTRHAVNMIHNCLVVTDSSNNFVTLKSGTEQKPEAYFVPTQAGQYYWPTGLLLNKPQNELYVFLDRIQPGIHGGFSTAGIDVATIALPYLTIKKIDNVFTNAKINWGAAFLNDGQYIYMYGTESAKYNKFIHVARVDTKVCNRWQSLRYYDGSNWVKDSTKSARIKGDVSEFYSLFSYQGNYYLLSQGKLLTPDIFMWDAQSPVGPFSGQRLVYTTPQTQGTIYTYNPTVNMQFTEKGALLIGYSTNSTDFLELFRNADAGRPYFIRAYNWE